MLTIQINGKTYQIIDLKGRIKSTIEEWISAGYLEEVKENKDSILEKLREWVDKELKLEGYEHQIILNKIGELLETKEETIHIPPVSEDDKGVNQPSRGCIDKMAIPEWTPTPGQMIEVSNDGEKWEQEPRKFVKNNPTGGYEVEYKGLTSMTDYFEYARPLQPQEDIELPRVPEWKAFPHDGQTYDSKDYQIGKLTKFCQTIAPIVNQLIKANKKLGK